MSLAVLSTALPVALSALLSNVGDRTARLLSLSAEDPPQRPPTRAPRPVQCQRRLTPDQVNNLVAAYRAGATVYQLAERYQVRRTTVSGHLKRRGITLRMQPLTSDQVRRAIQFYEQGDSLVRVGDRLGCSSKTVHNTLVAAGVPRRDSHGRGR